MAKGTGKVPKEREERKPEVPAVPEDTKKSSVPAPQMPIDYETDEGAGFENVGAGDVSLPFLVVLQSGSPQLKRGENQIEDAREGDIFNTVTQQAVDGIDGIFVVPCLYKKLFVEWKPRETGGGFVNQYEDEAILKRTVKNQRGQDVLDNGNLIVTTAYHYVLYVDPITGDTMRAVIGMASTQLKKSRRWNALMTGIKLARPDGSKFVPAMFSHMYKLTTVPESNEQGSWSGWQIDLHSVVSVREIYQEAKKFASDLKAGLVREAAPPQVEAGSDEQVPF